MATARSPTFYYYNCFFLSAKYFSYLSYCFYFGVGLFLLLLMVGETRDSKNGWFPTTTTDVMYNLGFLCLPVNDTHTIAGMNRKKPEGGLCTATFV